ncbi:hypothetical protein [Deinococcus maricopensis]|uniref:Cytochrome b561 bacterial/Ni-hydrogenase domain-containing protein n=1 Tax=Deinococcus maricopensis (strain DSM 21211 / LMG 22137 / NRRL B-23946 / LB-34) TaxID=709986 RepID=E8U9P6_DEIML|nr:hypothetical protein [Deinococcus maricopensis]ADV67785.1 hypothetical protein Deima_2145 [Deinococcus maricopensis DSM 21211]
MYEFFLTAHNWLRWAVLLAGLYAFARALSGMGGAKPFTRQDRTAGSLFTGLMDLQLLIGLILYFALSPITKLALANFGAAMKVQEQRFFAVEHLLAMIVAVVFAHLGTALSKRQDTARAQFRTQALWYGLSLVAMLAMIPWWRPLLRGLTGA